MAVVSDANKLDFIDAAPFLPWDWRNVGAVFQSGRSEHSQSVSARCSFTMRRGFDALDAVDYGRVVEGGGDVGVNLRAKNLAFHLGASNLAYKSGDDAPLSAIAPPGGALASLKATVAAEYAEDAYVAASYDLLQKKPEFAAAWSGETFTDRATLSLHLDPVDGLARLRAAVAFAGPEWRVTVYDEAAGRVEPPRDDGSRHVVWITNVSRRRQPMAATAVGARVDLNRLANWAADYFDYNLESKIPHVFWRLPLAQRLYNLVVPAEDENQERYRLRGLCLEFEHDFARATPTVGVSKRIGGAARATALYDTDSRTGQVALRVGGLTGAVTVTRAEGAGWREWSSPSLSLSVEPLAFL